MKSRPRAWCRSATSTRALSRTVRDAVKVSGKPVDLSLEGADTELDNNIVQQISDPLIHLVRNAVAHGIEDAETRRRAGKPEKGRIAVRAYHRGNHIFIEVEDDGRGINYESVRQSVVDSGAMSSIAAAGADRARAARISFPSRILDRFIQVRAGRARRGPRRGALQRSRAERRNRNSLRNRPRRVLHRESAAHADYFAGALHSLRHIGLRIPARGRGRNSPAAAGGNRRRRRKAAHERARRRHRSRAAGSCSSRCRRSNRSTATSTW